MKKYISLLSFLVLFTAFTCDDEPLDDEYILVEELSCEEATQNLSAASANFVVASPDDANYSTLCLAYKAALQDQITACGDPNGALQTLIDSLDCGEEQTNDDVVGTWLLTAWIGENPIDLNDDGTENINFLDEMDCYNNETMVFNQDGTGVNHSTSYADIYMELEVGTTNSYYFQVDCIDEVEDTNFTWTQTGNIVTMLVDDGLGGTEEWEWTVNGNEMSITIPEGFYVVASEDITVTTIQDLTFVYTKQ